MMSLLDLTDNYIENCDGKADVTSIREYLRKQGFSTCDIDKFVLNNRGLYDLNDGFISIKEVSP